jgi:metallo-beta-lactamase family protein
MVPSASGDRGPAIGQTEYRTNTVKGGAGSQSFAGPSGALNLVRALSARPHPSMVGSPGTRLRKDLLVSRTFPTVEFFGAAGTVTGSKHLVTANGRKVLLDCGLFQGLKSLRERNWQPPPFAPAELDAVVLSHAHIDHSGYLPLLVRRGFHGPVYCTRATADLLQSLLPDSAYLQEKQASHANYHGYSKHAPALPLYTMADADAALALLEPQPFGQAIAVTDGIGATFRTAGHILGSATVDLTLDGGPGRTPTHLVFSGDLGRWGRPILHDPQPVPHADYLLLESTYGNRTHSADVADDFSRSVRAAAERGGALLVPAFAVGRTQELLWWIRQLEDDGRIPELPVYIDSPMAIDVTDVYLRHTAEHDLDMRMVRDAGHHPLYPEQFRLAKSQEESMALNHLRGPIVIISASGMATGGRILHHMKLRLPDRRTTVLLAGFQAAGTRGRLLQEQADEVRIHGREITVRANIETLDGLSAHADQGELLQWLSGFEEPPKQTRLVHGEPEGAAVLAQAIRERYGWSVDVAEDGGKLTLE